jgi:hypothetical protein
MTYLDQVWFFLFAPGKRDCIVGYSDRIIRDTEQDYDDDLFTKWAADETAMAKEFDVKFEQVSRGMAIFVGHIKKLGEWQASTVQSNLEL